MLLTAAVALGLWAVPGARQAPPGVVAVRLETALGNIDLAIDTEHAPVTTANFLKYVDAGLYDGANFYRVTRPDNYVPAPPNRPPMEIIQGGLDRSPNRSRQLPPIPLERTSVTGLRHVRGTIAMARGNTPDTATSEFFILLDDQPSLDFGGKRFDDGQGTAAFGHVASGMDVVRRIQQEGPLQPNNRQYLVTPVTILHARRIAR
jgi:peptidyl-prolyl cis-trans isomerase A (cyclophilin A)